MAVFSVRRAIVWRIRSRRPLYGHARTLVNHLQNPTQKQSP